MFNFTLSLSPKSTLFISSICTAWCDINLECLFLPIKIINYKSRNCNARKSDCCLTPNEQIFSYMMTRTSCIQ